MNSALYVPDPKKWINYFQKKPSDIFKVDTSTIKLTSPVQSVVERAKSELDRINTDAAPNTIITTSSTTKGRPNTRRINKKRHKSLKTEKKKSQKQNKQKNKNQKKKIKKTTTKTVKRLKGSQQKDIFG